MIAKKIKRNLKLRLFNACNFGFNFLMKRKLQIVAFTALLALSIPSFSQCAMCTKTAQQLGEGPAQGLNAGIIYLALIPFMIAGYIFYRWKKSNNPN